MRPKLAAYVCCLALAQGAWAIGPLLVVDAAGKKVGHLAALDTRGAPCPGSAVVVDLIGHLTTLHVGRGEAGFDSIEPVQGEIRPFHDDITLGACGTMFFLTSDCTGPGYLTTTHTTVPGTRPSSLVYAGGRWTLYVSQSMNEAIVTPRSAFDYDGTCFAILGGLPYGSVPLDTMFDIDVLYRRPYRLKVAK